MAGFITAEGLVIPAGTDTYDYVADQRRLSSSIRSVVPVADIAEGDSIASAMASDGRPVSDTNPLVVWQADQQSLNVKGSAGWHSRYTTHSAVSPTGYTVTGTFYKYYFGTIALVTASLTVIRTGANVVANGGGVSYQSAGVMVPAACISSVSGLVHWNGFTSGAGTAEEFQFLFNCNSGLLQFRGSGGGGSTNTWVTNGQTNFQLTYPV